MLLNNRLFLSVVDLHALWSQDFMQCLNLAKRDQEILLGRRGHYDLSHAEILNDEGAPTGRCGVRRSQSHQHLLQLLQKR